MLGSVDRWPRGVLTAHMLVDEARRRRIMGLALPIIGGMVSQNVLNLVDTAMVGRLGDDALAGVGLGSFVNFMCIAFVTGMSTGVQATAARRKGEGRTAEMAVPLNGGLLLAALIAVPASAVLIWLAPAAFPLVASDPEVARLGTDYLQVRLGAMVAVGMNFAFRGYWNAVELSRLYLRTLVVMHAVNIALNWLLIFGNLGFPEMGVRGAALGTAISTYVGTAMYVSLGLSHARSAGFLRAIPTRREVLGMLRLAGPAGLQNFLFAAGMTVFFKIVGMVGTRELAAANVLVNLMLVALLPAMGFGLAAASLVGQALGRGDPDDARRWGWDVVRLAGVTLLLLAMPALVAPRLLLGLFLVDPETLEVAVGPLRLIAATLPFEALGMVLLNALFGAGATATVMVVSVGVQWLLQLPLVYLAGVRLGLGFFAIYVVLQGARGLQAGILAGIWRRGGWARTKV